MFSYASRLHIFELLLLGAALVTAADAASQKASDQKVLEMGSGGRVDHPRRPLLRQEHPSSSIEISSRGASLARGNQSQQADPPDGFDHGKAVTMPEDDNKFSSACVDYPRDLGGDAADPISTGQYMCSGKKCLEDDYPSAKDKCCNCNGGAQFRIYENTQCMGEEGLSRSGDYDGKQFKNPQPFQDVEACMETCWGMGKDCTGISVVNEESDFSGMCYFRKGNLQYIHDYHSCYTSDCMKRIDEVDNTIIMTTQAPPDNDTRLAMCTDEDAFQNTDCETDPAKARPKVHPAPTPPPPNQDQVVDKRDCFVKYLWYLPS